MLSIMCQVKLFISHSERDYRFVKPLHAWLLCGLGLNASEVRCTSVDGADPGEDTDDILRADLESAKAIVGLITTNSLNSTYAQFEMGAAWVQTRLQPVRGPGVRVADLRPPLNSLATPCYCDRSNMQNMVEKLAERLGTEIVRSEEANKLLEEMCSHAEETLKVERKRWFTLAPLLSAYQLEKNEMEARIRANRNKFHKHVLRRFKRRNWRDAPRVYSAAFSTLCQELELDSVKLQDCVRPSGLVLRDPDELPSWATDVWRVSQYVVNEMLDFGKASTPPPDILRALSVSLVERMHSALDHEKPREQVARDMQQWFEDAKHYIGENLPPEHSGHSARSH